MKLEIDQTVHIKGLIKMEWTLLPITFRRQELDHHKAHECPKRLEIKICSICPGKGHSWKNCEHGNNIDKHKCLNCERNHTSTAKSCPELKRIINRRNRSQSRPNQNRNNYNRSRDKNQRRNSYSRSYEINNERSSSRKRKIITKNQT